MKLGIYGLPTQYRQARIVYLPITWDATTSYLAGTHRGPEAIFSESNQVDFFHAELGEPDLTSFHWEQTKAPLLQWNREARMLAKKIQAVDGNCGSSKMLRSALKKVNNLSSKLNDHSRKQTLRVLQDKKIPGIVGGDHSVPFGAFQAAAEIYSVFGILHFDAHSDTRNAYHGFEYSHASIMHNALTKIPNVVHLTQVGIRDYCQEEANFLKSQGSRVSFFSDQSLWAHRAEAKPWSQMTQKIVETLPQNVWISFDIDGLDPRFCPNTGTPVPGGLDFNEAVSIIQGVAKSGRKIIGFDLCEVSPGTHKSDENPWNGNVGMRLLYLISLWTLFSQRQKG